MNIPTLYADGHLGGCSLVGDAGTEHPIMWRYLVEKFKIGSVIDIGAGFGYHALYFQNILNLKTLCIEGAALPASQCLANECVQHDYVCGPFFTLYPYDLAWSCEFVEHIEEKYIPNFMATFQRCKYVAMTHALPEQDGYHHVNCRPAQYWIEKMDSYGFDVDMAETFFLRKLALMDFEDYIAWRKLEHKYFRGYSAEAHLSLPDDFVPTPFFANTGLFFINRN